MLKHQVLKRMDFLKDLNIVLGSQSPRRQELLERIGVKFEVVVKAVDESIVSGIEPEEIVERIALRKLEAFNEACFFDKLIITADTVVVYNGYIYGKPKDQADGTRMLKTLQGNVHKVLTAVAFSFKGKTCSFVEETLVEFYPLSAGEILYYLDNFKPFDKAGSYGIQEWIGAVAVKSVRGSFDNVVGLPTARLYHELRKFLCVD